MPANPKGDFLKDLAADGLPLPVEEYAFAAELGRKWRFDWAWPDQKLALEFEGGSWSGGGHTRGKHFESDCVKYAIAVLLGWRVLRVNNHMLDDGRAVLLVTAGLDPGEWKPGIRAIAGYKCEKCLTKKEKLKRAARRLKEEG